MSNQNPITLSLHQQTHYRIIVQGVLGDKWQDYFSGFRFTYRPEAEPAGQTILTSESADHPMLLGALNQLYSLGFPLLKVEWLGVSGANQNDNVH